jgi:hypothetical protein
VEMAAMIRIEEIASRTPGMLDDTLDDKACSCRCEAVSLTHRGRVQERLVAANSWPFLFWSPSIDQDAPGGEAHADQPDAIATESAGLGAPDGGASRTHVPGLLLLHHCR